MNVGWIGLGRMGTPISRRIHAAGHTVTALVRSDEARARAIASGYGAVSQIKDVATHADVIFSSVSDDAALLDIVTGPDGLAAHLNARQIFVETSTVSPDISARVALLLRDSNVAYLRAPVSGSVATADAGALAIMVSGPRNAYDQTEQLLASFTRKRFYLGAHEQARYMKLALNIMVGATSSLLAEAVTLGRKGGVDLATALDIFCQSAIASPLIEYKRAMIMEGIFDPAFSVSGMMKDFDIALSTGRSAHVPLPITAQVRQQYEEAFLRGNGERDFFVLVKEMTELVGLADDQ